MPTPTAQVDSRYDTRKREFERESISPAPTAEEDIILAGESDDDSDTTRSRKKARREAFAQHYLEHGWVPIMTASLKGPFENGWKNPWAKAKPETNAIGHSSRASVKNFIRQQEESPSPAPRRIARIPIKSRDAGVASTPISLSKQLKAIPSRARWTPIDDQDSSVQYVRKQSPQQRFEEGGGLSERSHTAASKFTDGRQNVYSSDHSGSRKLKQATACWPLPTKSGDERYIKSRFPSGSGLSAPKTSKSLSRSSSTSIKQASEFALDLEDDLNMIWSRGSLHKDDGILQTMKWQTVISKGSAKQGFTRSRRVLFYGNLPVLLDNGHVNDFTIHHLNGIRAKLSQGIVKISQRLNKINATRDPSEAIAYCNMLSELAGILQKVDDARRQDTAHESSSNSSPSLGLHALQSKLHHLATSGYLSRMSTGGSTSSEQHPAYRQMPGSQTYYPPRTEEAPVHMAQTDGDNHARSLFIEGFENDGHTETIDPDISEQMDISFESQAAAKSLAQNPDHTRPATPNDINTLTSSRDTLPQPAFSAKSKKVNPLPPKLADDDLYHGDSDELRLGDTVFVVGASNPFANVKSPAITSSDTKKETETSPIRQGQDQSEDSARESITPPKPNRDSTAKSLQATPTRIRRSTSAHQSPLHKSTPSQQKIAVLGSPKAQLLGRSPRQARQQTSDIDSSKAKTPATPRQSMRSLDLSQTPVQLRTADKSNAIAKPAAMTLTQQHGHDSSAEIHFRDGITDPGETTRTPPLANAPTNTEAVSQEVDVVELDSGSETSDSETSQSNNGRQNDSSTPKSRLDSQGVVPSGRDSATGSTSVMGTNTARESPSVQTSHPATASPRQIRLSSLTSFFKRVQTNVEEKIAQISQGQSQKSSEHKDNEHSSSNAKGSTQNSEPVNTSVALINTGHTNESTIPEGQQPTQLDRIVISSEQLATEVPPLRWADTVESDQLLPLGVAITKTSSTSRQSPQVTPGLSTPAVMHQFVRETRSDLVFPASQPVSRSATRNHIRPRRARSTSAAIGDERPVTNHRPIEVNPGVGSAAHISTESSFEDAQRQSPQITDSEEREALDEASSFLDWNVEKEAFASK